ncbi:hypothetical protein SteCoe_34272 [Stentor coeruleus]|uniref:Uncharacterized protein n=1 Tax=Stentor coeruleus TaxID=5963 RepID=A0A1R2AUW8_9CILI|nr:hypothetical protein SteCoe_34272 [Stentor coeruleus]
MSDHQKPLLDKEAPSVNPHSETPGKPKIDAAAASLKSTQNQVIFARRVHNLLTIQFLVVTLLVYLISLSDSIQAILQDIWVVFTVLVLYFVVGAGIIYMISVNIKSPAVAIFVLAYLTLSLTFLIGYLGASAKNMIAALGVSIVMSAINLFYSILCQIYDDRITTSGGIWTGIVGSIILDAIFSVFSYYTDGNVINWYKVGIIFFVTILYAVYIFLNVKGMADGGKEGITKEDYMICAIMVYLDFSIGLIIAICREVCSSIAG